MVENVTGPKKCVQLTDRQIKKARKDSFLYIAKNSLQYNHCTCYSEHMSCTEMSPFFNLTVCFFGPVTFSTNQQIRRNMILLSSIPSLMSSVMLLVGCRYFLVCFLKAVSFCLFHKLIAYITTCNIHGYSEYWASGISLHFQVMVIINRKRFHDLLWNVHLLKEVNSFINQQFQFQAE